MKIVRGIVREEKVNDVIKALDAVGAPGLTVTRVHGRGATAASTIVYRGVHYEALRPMSVVDVIASDDDTNGIAQAMLDGARTGCHGDGHVCVFDLENAYPVFVRWPRVA